MSSQYRGKRLVKEDYGEIIFKGLAPSKVYGRTVDYLTEWRYTNTEKYKIKKYLKAIEKKDNNSSSFAPSNYISVDNIFEEEIKKNILEESGIKPREPEKITINEIPIGVTEEDEIICIEKNIEKPTIFISGQVGCGKTLVAHRLTDYFYHHFAYKFMLLNDYKIEMKPWVYPDKPLNVMGENGCGLPIVFMVPDIENHIEIKNIALAPFKIGWADFLEHIATFSGLGESEKYLLRFKDRLKDVKDINELRDRITLYLPGRANALMRNKLLAVFEKYLGIGIVRFEKDWQLDCTRLYVYQNDKLIFDDEPLLALARINLVPVLVTADLQVYSDIYQRCMAYWIDRIIEKKNKDTEFRKEDLMLYIEELSTFCDKKKSPAIFSIKNLVQRGRLLNMGGIFVTQNISEIPSEVVSNCKYHLIFAMPSDRDVSLIGKNLNLDSSYKKAIKELQQFECLVISKEKSLIVYDLKNNRKYRKTGIFKVRIFFSLGQHQKVDNWVIPTTEKRINWKNYAAKVLLENDLSIRTTKNEDSYNILASSSSPEYMLNQERLFVKPKLTEGMSISRYFYAKNVVYQTISYNELKKRGYVIITDSNGYHSCVKIGKATNKMIVHTDKPADVIYIVWNEWHNTPHLIGRHIYHKIRGRYSNY